MCGIVGVISTRDVTPILMEGLRRLEYRGYDSAGIARFNPGDEVERIRRVGKVQELSAAVAESSGSGCIGVAHTRWATHGAPTEANAHPHMSSENIAVVHNGIIENHEALRQSLTASGYSFTSETDTEVVAHLIHRHLQQTDDLAQAVKLTTEELRGAYALAVIDKNHPEVMIAAREGSPLVLGVGLGENFVASDQLALLPVTTRFVFLEDGDLAVIGRNEFTIADRVGDAVVRPIKPFTGGESTAEKGEYRHYMIKEIFEQPTAIRNTMDGYVNSNRVDPAIFGDSAPELFAALEAVQIIACGTSFHAGLVAKYWIESIAGVQCNVEVASEFRYRTTVVRPNTLFVTISQSGETADTLSALRNAQGYLSSLSICNVSTSSLVRESALSFITKAGPEIGVASTKAFTTQLVALYLLTVAIAKQKGLAEEKEVELLSGLKQLPDVVQSALRLDQPIERMAEKFAEKHHALFLGRGVQYPIAMEGALKLKEISYIHAEAYPAGELKHGPLALVDADMPVVTVAPSDALLEKLKSNLQEVQARGGELFVFQDAAAAMKQQDDVHVLDVPSIAAELAPIVYTIPLQLLSYHVAIIKGTDVDQPRNLAKSVTVE